jgi:predicted TPR repeat methyltransferase
MSIEAAYNAWSESYDTMLNKTRDLEGSALRKVLLNIRFNSVLEMGCGTGKNTEWLVSHAKNIISVDFSEEMLAKAKAKLATKNVQYIRADINNDWAFANKNQFDLITFSLVLEHIQNLGPVFTKASECLSDGGYLYLGELHPFKQYSGSKARFEASNGIKILECYTHHVSEYFNFAAKNGFKLVVVNEFFDENENNELPRIITFLFQKNT